MSLSNAYCCFKRSGKRPINWKKTKEGPEDQGPVNDNFIGFDTSQGCSWLSVFFLKLVKAFNKLVMKKMIKIKYITAIMVP